MAATMKRLSNMSYLRGSSVGLRRLSVSSADFYKVADLPRNGVPGSSANATAPALGSFIRGEIIDNAVDLKNARPGETIEGKCLHVVANSLFQLKLTNIWYIFYYSCIL
jgi:hypothetical protein